MIERLVRRAFFWLTAPLRLAMRYELARKDIAIALERKACESSADYVLAHMGNADSTFSELELLTAALGRADLASAALICEFGVFSGRTINHIASHTPLTVYGFDSFEGLPGRWRDGFDAGHFKVSALPKVRKNVTLIKGWFNETLPPFILAHQQERLGFLHIDCDLYSSTKTIFELLEDKIHPGCVIVFDEYFNYPGWREGEYKAFQEFLARTGLSYEYIGYHRFGEQVAVRIK
jgi:hypothetical protein